MGGSTETQMQSLIANHQRGFEDRRKKMHWRSREWLSAPRNLGGMGFPDFVQPSYVGQTSLASDH
jgi:hypothetical protein